MPFPILTSLIVLPIAGSGALLFIRDDDGNRPLIRRVGLVVSLLVFAESLLLPAWFNGASPEFQFIEHHQWIPAFGISYAVGIDGISLLLVLLTTFLTPLALLSSWDSVRRNTRAFTILLLALES